MSGFPHSEICGSKVAHTSPQLIAACHVLHRLYAPRHPRIALTSRLRAHTTNINAGSVQRPTRNSAEQRRAVSWCGMIISARFVKRTSSEPRTRQPRGRRSFAQSRYLHGIDFKNPFTMSKRSLAPITACSHTQNCFSSSLGMWQVVELIGIEPMT